SKCFITVSVGMVRVIICHQLNTKNNIISGSEVSRLSVAIHSVAKRETRLADDVRLLRQEERERRKNIEKLIQIERNGKARIRRVTKSRTE
ncbi:hypothetical protein K6476_16945, partial [Escherichia coli]|nr:hypothetical protein [Escherichia coli]